MAKLKCPEGGTTYKIAGSDPIYSDPEFKGLLDPLLPAELGQLEANIMEAGKAFDPVVVWKETRIILDGHNRIEICAPRKIPWKVTFMNFPNTPEGRTAALMWVIDHQAGRRNQSAEAKAKLVQWRRERVAGMRQAGESTRTIAEKENVSQATVLSDLKKATERGQSVEPAGGVVTSKDGSKRTPTRAERVGGANGTPFVVKGERMAGDDTDQIKTDRKEARSDPKNGQVGFDWAAFNREFANFILNVDKLGKLYKKHQTGEATTLRSDLLTWKNAFKKWATAISKKTPTPDVVDKVWKKGKK